MAGINSGGYSCARLWQAWGVLEAREGDHDAARRCFSRALDADNRNVAAITAWTLMEEKLGNYHDARLIFDRSLTRFPAASDDKMALWRAYELMEQRAGNTDAALQVFQRSMRESMTVQEASLDDDVGELAPRVKPEPSMKEVLQQSQEVEVVRWGGDSSTTGRMRGDVWMNNGSIEGKVPLSSLKKKVQKKNSGNR
jgi:tetratricopeptide (TPR) repeat protein